MGAIKFPTWVSRAFALGAALSSTSVAAQNSSTSDFDTKCTNFASTVSSLYPNTTVQYTTPVAAGTTLEFPDVDASCLTTAQVVAVDMCRVSIFVPTSDRSNLTMEVWLPTPDAWTGRFLSTGNGGLGGCIQYDDLAYTVDLGFSTVATNNGHNGQSGLAFYNNSEVVEDFAYRAMHTGVVIGKEVSKAFYGEEHKKSYYLGCSTGGRQGFKAAQDFPDDFDGWVVGAPALAFSNLTGWSGSFYAEGGPSNASTFVPLAMWPVIHDDILSQCDDIDGYVDGIIEDPSLCYYNVSKSLLCSSGGNSSSCLTDVQAETVRIYFSPVINTQDNSLVFPAMQPGSELTAQYIYYTGQPFSYTEDWMRYVIYNDPSWDPATLNSQDYTNLAKKNVFNIQTWNGDLSAVQDKGSKILHYHGQEDYIITSFNSPRYYEHVSETMGLNYTQLDDFYRFFRISGMGHCSGGPGATFVGQNIASNATLNPEGNVLTAMIRWVEEGIAPDTVLGTAYVNETMSSGEIAFQRRHCRWPRRNVYTGSGDPTEPDSWECIL